MEDENKWFKDDKKGMPLIEKFAMLFFSYLFIKYSAKAIKHVAAKTRKKETSWVPYWVLIVLSFLVIIFSGMLKDFNLFEDIIVIGGAYFIWAIIWEKWFMNNGDPSESKNENEQNV